jgi:hypothetical protein
MNARTPLEPLPAIAGDKFCTDIPTWDELVDRIIMLGYVYSLTGLTGHCKTALLVLLMLSVCTKQYFGPHPLKNGKVLYLCGENPVDAQLRFAVLLQALGLQADALKNSLVVVLPHSIWRKGFQTFVVWRVGSGRSFSWWSIPVWRIFPTATRTTTWTPVTMLRIAAV